MPDDETPDLRFTFTGCNLIQPITEQLRWDKLVSITGLAYANADGAWAVNWPMVDDLRTRPIDANDQGTSTMVVLAQLLHAARGNFLEAPWEDPLKLR